MAWSRLARWIAGGGILTTAVLVLIPIEVSTARPQDLPTTPAAAALMSTPASAVITRYCAGCHSERTRAGGLVLLGMDREPIDAHPDAWEKVVRRLRTDTMPPMGSPRPTAEARAALLAWVESGLDASAARHPNPGRTAAVHRLNRSEYQNAVRDLLGVEADIAGLLPPDGQNFGFDNIGDALSMSPMLLDRYLSVSLKVSRLAVGGHAARPVSETYLVPSDQGGQDDRLAELPYGTRGGMRVEHHFPIDGEYEISLKLARNYNFQVVDLNEPHDLEVMIDGERRARVTVKPLPGPRVLGGPEADDDLKFRLPIRAGRRAIAASFIRRSSAYSIDERLPFIRGDAKLNALHGQPWLAELTVTGPISVAGATPLANRSRIFVCEPRSAAQDTPCAQRIFSTLARRAYRRPVTTADLRPLLAAYEESRSQGFDAGIEAAIGRMLMSPSFLFRVEIDPESAPSVHRVSDLELASRLSFFLWSSIPDDDLLAQAERGRLKDPAVLNAQVTRMLADPRADMLTKNFAGQWLELRRLQEVRPDQQLFPNFDGTLRDDLRTETELFFRSIVQENRPVIDLLTADYSFVNERLARHYGLPGIYGARFRRVQVPEERRGLLGQGSVHLVTSYGNRTSPVLRGVWILSNLLGTPPPPPPPDVPDLQDTNAVGKALSMREQMERHRTNASCASCHSIMDPLGLSLENFDGIGSWRVRTTTGEPIDVSGALPDGTRFEGVNGLRRVLVQQQDVFIRTLVEKLLIYALGRNVELSDGPAVRAVMKDASADGFRMQRLIAAIARSLPFQWKQSAASKPSPTTLQ